LIGMIVLGMSTITFSQLFAYARELLAASEIAPGERALYMNIFRMFFALSWTVGPTLAAWVMLHFSYREMFLCAAANFALFAGVVAWRVPAAPPPAPKTPPAPPTATTVPPPAAGGAGLKACPSCGKEIPAEYLVCPFCNAVTQ